MLMLQPVQKGPDIDQEIAQLKAPTQQNCIPISCICRIYIYIHVYAYFAACSEGTRYRPGDHPAEGPNTTELYTYIMYICRIYIYIYMLIFQPVQKGPDIDQEIAQLKAKHEKELIKHEDSWQHELVKWRKEFQRRDSEIKMLRSRYSRQKHKQKKSQPVRIS